MVTKVITKRCLYCGQKFVADARIGQRQKACSKACQRLRKRQNNAHFSRSNPGYWTGRYAYLKAWRDQHPDYQRQWRESKKRDKPSPKPPEIQAEMLRKAIEFTEKVHVSLCEIQAEIFLQRLGIAMKNVPRSVKRN
jgi:hypothetical protein